MDTQIPNYTHDEFITKLAKTTKPILVDFSAEERCAPCRSIQPVLEKLAEDLAQQIEIVKVDVDAEPALAAQYKVRGIPTLMIFKHGQAISSKVGALSYNALKAFVSEFGTPTQT